MGEASGRDDPYSRVDYRRVVAWERRLRRESPLLLRLLDEAPDRSVVDLGCGTGEHVAFLAEHADRAVGIDRSPTLLATARSHEEAGRGRFLLGDAEDAPALLAGEGGFGLALCLGNVLPHVQDETALAALLGAVHEVLVPGGLFLVQLLNYERILEQDVRHLPLNFRDGEDGREVVFLRLLQRRPEGRILFFPTTLELDPEAEEPVRVRGTKRVPLRAWTKDDVGGPLEAAGFEVRWHGDLEGGDYAGGRSNDLVIVATRRA